MTYNNNLIIFSKAPRYASVKKRLASKIGDVEALRFYQNNLLKNLRILGRDKRWNCWLALSDNRSNIRKEFADSCRVFYQCDGDLGQKMEYCLNKVLGESVVLIGGDIPNIRKSTISIAFKKLKFYDLVFGPSFDGGFWLIGVKGAFSYRQKKIKKIFDSVRWSSQHTLFDVKKNIQNKKIFLLDSKNDIDTVDDFMKYKLKISQYN